MSVRTQTVTANFDEIEQAFAIWNDQAKEGQWPARDDATGQAEHLILLIGEIQAGAH